MKKEPVFLGLYSRQSKNGDTKGETRWNVWGLDGGMFLAQQTEDSGDAPGERETIDSPTFFNEFRVHAAFSSRSLPKNAPAKEELAAPATQKNTPAEPREAVREAEPATPVQQAQQVEELDEESPFSSFQAGMEVFVDDDDDFSVGFKGANEEESVAEPFAGLSEKMQDSDKKGGATFFVDKSQKTSPSSDFMDTAMEKVEEQIRSEFSIAIIRLRSDREQALKNLEKLLEYEAPFKEEHKHMFTEFGTALRRRQLYAMACRFHERAMHLSPGDEHILFNLARALYDAGKIDKARKYLRDAVAMANDFQAGSDFLEFIEGKHGDM